MATRRRPSIGSGFVLARAVIVAASLVACANDAERDTAAVAASEQTEASEITLDNWQNHARIVEIRKIVEAVDAGLERGELRRTTTGTLCEDFGDLRREKVTDLEQRIRRIQRVEFTGEVQRSTTYYYDVEGRLRFAFLFETGAASAQNARIYFDADGNHLWEVHQTVVPDEGEEPEDVERRLSSAGFSVPDVGGFAPLDEDEAKNSTRVWTAATECF